MAVTEITLTGGERITINSGAEVVEAAILAAARGSIMELAWMTDARTGQRMGVNPDHVIMLRELATGADVA